MRGKLLPRVLLAAALVVTATGAALSASAQRKVTQRPEPQASPTPPKKVSSRPEDAQAAPTPDPGPPSLKAPGSPKAKEDPNASHYVYEFKHPDFFVYFIHVEHDERGRGHIRFERRTDTEQLTEPMELSPAVLERLKAHWTKLRFLESNASYQGERNYPSQGMSKLTMRQGGRSRTAEFNYSPDPDAQGLVNEYRRAADQALFVFDLQVALESQPLDTPKLIDRLGGLVDRDQLSDKKQLIPLVKQLAEDERVPLVGRNQAARILKKLEEEKK
ncbi:MAG TPA: hypothetical protein VK422_08870 [Pyrinomonadaceae bacterium]|nr:hypothetical protein [Pyrinomonadaceae bacterium]